MAYRIFHDVANGANVLMGVVDGEPIDKDALPADMVTKVERFATTLGLDASALSSGHFSFLTDVLDRAIHALSDEPVDHAQAGAQEQPAAGAAGPQAPAEAKPPVETAPVSERPPNFPAAEHPAETPEAAAPPPPDTDEPVQPVTTPSPGHQICPTCNGLRDTVAPSGQVKVCSTCNGAGEVPAQTEGPPPPVAA